MLNLKEKILILHIKDIRSIRIAFIVYNLNFLFSFVFNFSLLMPQIHPILMFEKVTLGISFLFLIIYLYYTLIIPSILEIRVKNKYLISM